MSSGHPREVLQAAMNSKKVNYCFKTGWREEQYRCGCRKHLVTRVREAQQAYIFLLTYSHSNPHWQTALTRKSFAVTGVCRAHPDGGLGEVAQVSVHGLSSGDAQQCPTERGPAGEAFADEVKEEVVRRERLEDG